MIADKEFITGVLGEALKFTELEVAELFKTDGDSEVLIDDAKNVIQSKLANHIANVKESSKVDTKKLFDDGYKKATSESLSKFETKIKERYGLQSDKQGDELIDEIITLKTKSKSNLTDADVKTHPVFLEYEKTQKKLFDEFSQEKMNEITNLKKQYERKEQMTVVKSEGQKLFRELKPILSSDPTRAMNQERDFLNKLDAFNFSIDNDEIVVFDGEKRLENKFGHPINFSDLIKEMTCNYFDIETQDNKGNTGAKNNEKSKVEFPTPKTENEYIAIMMDSSKPHEFKQKVKAYWETK